VINVKIKGVNMKKYMKVLSNSLIFLFLASMLILPANAALQAVSPTVNPATGFPSWYQDTTALALQPCLGTNLDGTGPADIRCVLPVATIPDIRVNASGFPLEAFYSYAHTELTINGNAARFRLLTEGSFLVEPPVNGQQVTFTRASLFANKAAAFPVNSTFRVVYPFGTFDFSTDGVGDFIDPPAGPGLFAANAKEMRAEDGGAVALDFAAVLAGTNTGITTFLRSSTLNIPGYIGDGITPTPVTGGTNGNVVTITQTAGVGPLLVVGGINWIVAGKSADLVPPVIVNTSAIPPTIDTNGTSILSANVTDNFGVASVTVDLSQIGGPANATMTFFRGNNTNGEWRKTVNSSIAGNFVLPVNALDGAGNAAAPSSVTLTVSNAPVVTAIPNKVTVGNLTSVTINVALGGAPVIGATVNLTGAVLPAPLTLLTDVAGNAIFASINATAAGTITVTANHPSFVAQGTTTITAAPAFIRGELNPIPGIDVGDVLFCAQFVAGVRTPTATQELASNVNTIPGIDVGDVLFIAQAAAGLRQL
jgi:hypothetical protein